MLIAPQISAADAALARRLQTLRAAIAAAAAASGRTEESVTLVAVSKGHGAERVRAAAALGLAHFGESYLQEALPKRRALADLVLCWHFIGRVQANKTRPIAEQFDWVHGLDRLHIAERLSAQRPAGAAALNVCIHVNIAAEAGKAGVAPAQLPELATAVARLPRLALRGLMCILPAGQSAHSNRAHFRALRELLAGLQSGRDRTEAPGKPDMPDRTCMPGRRDTSGRLDTLSMGMSADFREAVLEGATLLRVGTALFGPRAGHDPDATGGDTDRAGDAHGAGGTRGGGGATPPSAAGVG